MQLTYNSTDKDGTTTHGGYSSHVVVNDKFVLHVPDSLPLASTAPLLCAGITTYSPIKRFGFDKPGLHIGVVGLVSEWWWWWSSRGACSGGQRLAWAELTPGCALCPPPLRRAAWATWPCCSSRRSGRTSP